MSGFRVALPNPDAVDSWMVKNGLYSKKKLGGKKPVAMSPENNDFRGQNQTLLTVEC